MNKLKCEACECEKAGCLIHSFEHSCNKEIETTHNLKGCQCPKGSDIRFCLGVSEREVIFRNKFANLKEGETFGWSRQDMKGFEDIIDFNRQSIEEERKRTIKIINDYQFSHQLSLRDLIDKI